MKGRKPKTIVIKLGTSSIVDEQSHEPLLSTLSIIVEAAVKLHKDGCRVVLVSSGAIGMALGKMGLERRPKHLPQVQALAAIGQCKLMSLFDSLFGQLQQPIAQILLTRNDIADRTQYQNAQNTFFELLNMGIIPIVNENDTIAVTEIKFGDNDTLSAITAAMLSADYLFLMTDVDCLYDTNPRIDPNAAPISVVEDISTLAANVSSSGSALGTGGMFTKIVAARLATSAGVTTIITKSSKPGNVLQIVEYLEALKAENSLPSAVEFDINSLDGSTVISSLPDPPLHTRFVACPFPMRDHPFRLLHVLPPHGTVFIDEGAYKALRNKAGLLPVGVVDVEGSFAQQEAVKLIVVKRLKPLIHRAKRDLWHSASKSIDSDTSEPLTSSVPGTPQEAPNTLSLSAYLNNSNLGALEVTLDSTTASSTNFTSAPTPSSHPLSRSSSQTLPPLYASDPPPQEVGRALVNYSSTEIARIKGLQSSEIVEVLGFAESDYVSLRENVSLLKPEKKKKEKKESQEMAAVDAA